MQGIYWLASYPKSGNTWFRIFLINLLQGRQTPISINQLSYIPIASHRELFDQTTELSSADLTADEIDCLRPHVYQQMAMESETPLFLKIHDAYTFTNGYSLVPHQASLGAIYFIRNPLDVAVSFAHHMARDIDQVVIHMADKEFSFCCQTQMLPKQLRQRLLTWSQHVISWVDHSELSVHVMRYEDMLTYPIETFTKAVEFLGLSYNSAQIEQALALSNFSELQNQEKEQGFNEKFPLASSFFREGKMGSWQAALTKAQIDKITTDHGEVMARFGYL